MPASNAKQAAYDLLSPYKTTSPFFTIKNGDVFYVTPCLIKLSMTL
jgi:hypothetical protein